MDDLRRRFSRLMHGNGSEAVIPIDEQDVTPYEMRIANMKHDAAELLTAATAGEITLSDEWTIAQLFAIQETILRAIWTVLGMKPKGGDTWGPAEPVQYQDDR